MRPIIYWDNMFSAVTGAENIDNEDDGFLELHDGSIGVAAGLVDNNPTTVSGVFQEWILDLPSADSRPVLAVVSASSELDGFGINLSGTAGPGSGHLGGYHVVSGTGPQVFELYAAAASGFAGVKAQNRWRMAISQASAVILPVGEDSDAFARTTWWPQLAASGVWAADAGSPSLNNLLITVGDADGVLSWEGLGFAGATVQVEFATNNGDADGVTFSGQMNLAGFRPRQWHSFRFYQRWTPLRVSGAVFTFSGPSGSISWTVPSGDLHHSSTGQPQPVEVFVASGTTSGAANFVADVFRVSGIRNSSGEGFTVKLDVVFGTKTSPLPGHPQMFELGMFRRLPFPRDHEVGVDRTTVLRRTRLAAAGASPVRLREGSDLRETTYQLTTTRAETASGIQAFLESSDGGAPFLFRDDRGALYWAELPEPATVFNDEAGIFTYTLTVREVRAQ